MTNKNETTTTTTTTNTVIKMVRIGTSESGKGIHMSERMYNEYIAQGITKEQLAKYFGG